MCKSVSIFSSTAESSCPTFDVICLESDATSVDELMVHEGLVFFLLIVNGLPAPIAVPPQQQNNGVSQSSTTIVAKDQRAESPQTERKLHTMIGASGSVCSWVVGHIDSVTQSCGVS